MNVSLSNELKQLYQQGMSIRAIAKKLGLDRKTVRKRLGISPTPVAACKLSPFVPKVLQLIQQGLTGPRILREIRALGYTGGRTILGDFLRKHRGPSKSPRKAFRRFETGPAEEAQADWSPYRLTLAGVPTTAHCFSMVLAYSRRMWIGFYRNERLPSLLHAHVEAFRSFEGCARTVLYDNMTQVTLGRRGGQPLWNPAFLEFSKHYGFTPRVCRPRDPNRRGKGERPFAWIETDLLRGACFESWDDLNAKAAEWLETVANVRVHSTTRRRVDEMFAEERPLLIGLPSLAYPTDRREVRKVHIDGYVAIDGSYYPVPARLVGQYVTVRIYPQHVEILDAAGQVAVSHRIPARPTRLAAPEAVGSKRSQARSVSAMEMAFLARFPQARDFLEGLHRRMKSLLPIHLGEIQRLIEIYTQERVSEALQQAQAYRNYNVLAVRRILQRAHPTLVGPAPLWVGVHPGAMQALDGVETGSPQEYTLDSTPATEEPSHEN